jgi:hypothetical protein
MQVDFEHEGHIGQINYDPKTKDLEVDFPVAAGQQRVINYLTTEKSFRIPESQKIDDYRIDKARPTESLMYMELALCTMLAKINARPLWNTQTGGS